MMGSCTPSFRCMGLSQADLERDAITASEAFRGAASAPFTAFTVQYFSGHGSASVGQQQLQHSDSSNCDVSLPEGS